MSKKGLMVIGFAGLAAVISVIGACEIKTRHYNAAFLLVAVGDSEASVVARMGVPAVRERVGQPYLRYATLACTKPCAIRLWWEMPIMPGIEGWSVELGEDRKVVRTSHWVSP
jgi:hypothetical protein